MNLPKQISTLLTAILLVVNLSAQNMGTGNSGMHPKAAVFALEVYQDLTEYQTTEHLLRYSKYINQVVVEDIGASASNYPKLVSVGMVDKYNSQLVLDDAGFDPLNFNPLKYHFYYYSSEMQRFRVGESNYVITIKPNL